MHLSPSYSNFNIFIFLLLGVMSFASYAAERPTGRVILTLSGAVDETNSREEIQFDLARLNQLPQYYVTTHNPWTKGRHTYQGFSAIDLFSHLSIYNTTLQVTALNEYMTEIPLSDFVNNGAIFATHIDGQPMSVRNLGPIMVIYPFDENENLKSEMYYGRSIWQVDRIKAIVVPE